MDKLNVSIEKYMYWSSEIGQNKKCPKCDTALKKQHVPYLVFVNGEEDSLIMGNDAGSFCPKCPVVVLDADTIAEGLSCAAPKQRFEFHVAGIINIDAIPEEKKHLPLGTDDNPIPLVRFLNNVDKNNKTDRTMYSNSRVDEKRKLGRNDSCHCDSGKKYKKCCLEEDIKKYGRAVKL